MPIEELPGLPEVRFGKCGSLLVAAWSKSATPAGMELMERYEAELVAAHQKVSVLTLLVGAGRENDPKVRERAIAMQKRFDSALRGTAIAVTAKGFSAVIIRTFLAAFSLVSRGAAPLKTFSTVEEAVGWLKALPGQDPAIAGDPALAEAALAFVTPAPGAKTA